MTHLNNIPHILKYGLTHKNSDNRNPHFVTIGDVSLISTRNNKQVRVDNGDPLCVDAPTVTLGDFTPFYFGVKMPMLYVIQNGGNFVTQATHPKNIIYLACSVSKIINETENYYFSDGHGTDEYTTFYDHTRITDLSKIIDWAAVKASYWGGQENLTLKRKKQAEFLISTDLSAKLILGLGCYNEETKSILLDMGVEEKKIKIIPNAYY
ncbi:MAG TPA: DUF4433 domain-containing protein [Chitinophagaceae bacterium]